MAQPELIKDIDARVKKSGDTMTGKLYTTSNLNGSLACANTNGAFRIDGGTDYQTGAFLALNGVNSTYYPNAFQLVASDGVTRKELFGNIDGTLTWDNNTILHTGNKNLITADDISASRAHKNSWDFTQQHHSNEVTFDMDNAPGAPSSTGWINGFVSTHNNYLSSYIVNAHRTSDWYVGYGETVGVSPAWYKLLHSGNYNNYAPTLTGGGASGTWPISISGNAASLSSTLQISKGGTGGVTAQEARKNLGLNSVKLDYTINLNSYSTSNYYFVDFGSGILELDCEIHSPPLGAAEPYNQNAIHFLMIHAGWSDTPRSFIMLSQGCYDSTEITIMSIVSGNQGGLKGVYLRGGMTYQIRSNIAPNLNTTTKTYGNESYASGTSSFTTITNASTVWTNDGFQKSIFSIPLYGAVWNDYAEYRKAESTEPGRVVIESADGEMKLSTERLQPGAEIISDTFGFAIGETDEYKTPIAATGRVLAYPNEDRYSYPLGCAVCSGPNGTVSQMTREEIREYPERIIGTVSEIPEYKNWGTGNVEVNGRIWIRIK